MPSITKKCNCGVCQIGRWVKKRKGLLAWEDWTNDGLNLEGKVRLSDEPKLMDKLRYKMHFLKPYLFFKYRSKND